MLGRISKIGAAFDSLVFLLGLGTLTTILVMILAILGAVLSGNLKSSFIRRRLLLLPSLIFTITIIIGMTSLPIPMAAYHGTNQIQYDEFRPRSFRVYEAGAYDADTLIRVSMSVEADDRLEVYAYFSQNDTVIDSLFINITEDIVDAYGGVTRSLTLEPGLYDVSVNATLFLDGVEQDETYPNILINQSVASSFLPEIATWSSYSFILTIACMFLVLLGLCIGREEKTRRSEEEIDQEPPREGEVYGRKLGW